MSSARCSASLPPPSYLEVETHDSILVAQSHDRNRSRDVILQLDDLLARNRDIGAVGERNIARDLLLDGDLRASNHARFRRQALRIDFDPAGSKQALEPAVDGAVERLIDEQVGGVSAKSERRSAGGRHR